MNADLEAQLREMGGEYRAVVERLKKLENWRIGELSNEGKPPLSIRQFVNSPIRQFANSSIRQFSNFPTRYLVAASLLVVLGLGAFLLFNFSFSNSPISPTLNPQPSTSHSPIRQFANSPISPSPSPYTLASLHTDAAVREIIRTQNADGSWTNDFLTRQNAAALKLCESAEARIAYKKAIRNLRVRGLL